jgi:hypothetical protein
VPISQKTRDADEKLREELRNADIGKLKKLMAPLIERSESTPKKIAAKRKKRSG